MHRIRVCPSLKVAVETSARYLHRKSARPTRARIEGMSSKNLRDLTNEQLIERVVKLEQQLREHTSSISSPIQAAPKKERPEKHFDPSRYHTRFIALKLAYLGQGYNGYEHHNNNTTPLPTIEEELWKALTKTKLIFPPGSGEVDWEGCEYSKCGRTDRGVSAFGQVIGIRVRSSRPKIVKELKTVEDGEEEAGSNQEEIEQQDEQPQWHHIHSEHPYPRLLNRVLPPSIRILAWCPSPPTDFSARFSCRARHYRYFFTNPAYSPIPGSDGIRRRRIDSIPTRDGWLDIEAMREAASYFVGEHDFRNFCKIDPSKQITNFKRRMFRAEIEEVRNTTGSGLPAFLSSANFTSNSIDKTNPTTSQPNLYTFSLDGSAFLWHQVRHMVAILFLVGQGLEPPTIVRDMLDTSLTPTKPMYEMADDAPLVLWDCIFPDLEATDAAGTSWTEDHRDSLDWVYVDGQNLGSGFIGHGDGRFGPGGLQDVVWAEWRRRKIDEVLAGSLLGIVAEQGRGDAVDADESAQSVATFGTHSTKVFDGGNGARLKGEYVPIMRRERQEDVDVQNKRYAERKGLPPKKLGHVSDGGE